MSASAHRCCHLTACDKACKDSCSASGADMCDECAEGYELEEETCKGRKECMKVYRNTSVV